MMQFQKKSSKVDPRIQAVVGCDDSIQTTLSSSDSMDSLQAKLGSTGNLLNIFFTICLVTCEFADVFAEVTEVGLKKL